MTKVLRKPGRVVGYNDRLYVILLGGTIGPLILWNLFVLFSGRLLAIAPLTIQLGIVASVLARHRSQVRLIRIWAGLNVVLCSLLVLVYLLARVTSHFQYSGFTGGRALASLASVIACSYLYAKARAATELEPGDAERDETARTAV